MLFGRPLLQVDLRDREAGEAAQRRLEELLGSRVSIVQGTRDPGQPRLVSLDKLPDERGHAPVIALGDVDLRALVQLLRGRPFIDHVISPRLLAGESAPLIAGALRQLLTGDALPELARLDTVSIIDSEAREAPLEAICERVHEAGGSDLVVERIRDVAEETITNALYNAPNEQGRCQRLRSEPVLLDPGQACRVAYGVVGKLFVLRVRDGFGSLRRERMCQVLERCMAKERVALDTSRGGAGLGLWRVFNAATVLLIDVRRSASTTITVALDLCRRGGNGARAVHLFFGEDA